MAEAKPASRALTIHVARLYSLEYFCGVDDVSDACMETE